MNIEALKAQLRVDEAERFKLYKDSEGKWTIGIGRNLEDVGISPEESAFLFNNDINRTAQGLDRDLPWWRTLDDARQNVLMNMAFNLGVGKLLGFVHTLAAIRSSNWQEAHDQMLSSKWAAQVGDRAQRLAKTMLTGVL